ncbi:hypothetical protein GLOIN_2v1783591 [Rhizophagus irregularis DAOM 181602=DAOM 197198]|nr:hypothetical protein GLOIN_2v1783591 [Rhizophagus irregularis DAOM 181602=DAOM 197198]
MSATITYVHDSTERLAHDYMIKEIIAVLRTDDNDATKFCERYSMSDRQELPLVQKNGKCIQEAFSGNFRSGASDGRGISSGIRIRLIFVRVQQLHRMDKGFGIEGEILRLKHNQ